MGQAGGGTRIHAKELHECALRRGHICICQDAHGLAAAHGCDQAAAEIVFVQHVVAVQAAYAVHKVVQPSVIEAADHHAHGVAHQRVVKAGEHQDPFAAGLCCKVMVQTFGANPADGVFGGVAPHAAKLHQLPAEMDIDPA